MVVGICVQQFAGSGRDVNVNRKKFKAISALTSVASDFDLIADWWFYAAVRNEAEVAPFWKKIQLAFCLVGLVTWLMVASDGRLIRPILKRYNVRGFSTGHLLLAAVLLEDVPQVVITLFIDKILDNGASTYAVINFMTAGYDLLIKLAEAFDERNDLHDTGGWLLNHFVGHDRGVTAVADVDGKLFLSGSVDKTLRLWHTRKNAPIRKFTGHKHRVSSVAVYNENTIISGSWDESVKLWDLNSGECLITFVGHTDAVTSVIVLDQNKIVSGSFDNTAKLWNTDTGRCIMTFSGHEYKVTSIVKIDDTHIVTGSSDLTAKMWNTVNGLCVQTFVGHSQSVTSVAYAGDSALLTSSSDATAKLWDLRIGSCLRTFVGHQRAVTCVINFDENSFITTSEDSSMKLWEKDTGRCLRSFQHNRNIFCMAKRPDQTVLTGESDRIVKQWSITTVPEKKGNERGSTTTTTSELDITEISMPKTTKAPKSDPKRFHMSSQIDHFYRQSKGSSSSNDKDIETQASTPSPQGISPNSSMKDKKMFWKQLEIDNVDSLDEADNAMELDAIPEGKSMSTIIYEKFWTS